MGSTDLILAPSVVDIAGLNRISLRILANAAAAVAGMVAADAVPDREARPMVAASMFGVTTRASRGRGSGSRSSATRCSSST